MNQTISVEQAVQLRSHIIDVQIALGPELEKRATENAQAQGVQVALPIILGRMIELLDNTYTIKYLCVDGTELGIGSFKPSEECLELL